MFHVKQKSNKVILKKQKRFVAQSPQNKKLLVIYENNLRAAHAKAIKSGRFDGVSFNVEYSPHGKERTRK